MSDISPHERIRAARILPVIALAEPDQAEPLAEALLAGGLDIMEITFRTAAAAEAIRRISKRFPNILVGAGTLLTEYQVRAAREAGAIFGVSPGVNSKIVKIAQEEGLFFAPGVMTPTEVEHALSLGCKLQKFFPAAAAGGPAMLKALAGPYIHTGIQFIPTGGIDESTMRRYLVLPMVAAVGGSWLVDPRLIAAGEWDRITELTRHAVEAAQTV